MALLRAASEGRAEAGHPQKFLGGGDLGRKKTKRLARLTQARTRRRLTWQNANKGLRKRHTTKPRNVGLSRAAKRKIGWKRRLRSTQDRLGADWKVSPSVL